MRSAWPNTKSFFRFTVIVSSFFLIAGCAAGVKMNSGWENSEIKIDGDASEWSKSIQQIPDKKISVGFRNNDKFLYICLASDDRSKIMMIARAGLIVWFEPESGDKNKFGIKYPMAITQSAPVPLPDINRAGGEGGNLENIIYKMLEQQNEFQIINKDKFPLTALPIVNNEGIDLKLGYRSNQFIYELKVPLATNKNYSYAADALPGEKIKIKFETEELNFEKVRGEGGGSEKPHGGRQGAGRQGGGGMRPGMGGTNMFEPLNLTVEINLEVLSGKK